MNSITIDDVSIPTTLNDIENLDDYEFICAKQTLRTALTYKKYIFNKQNITYFEELYNKYDSEEKSRCITYRDIFEMIKMQSCNIDKCKCPYKFMTNYLSGFYPNNKFEYSYCSYCRKNFSASDILNKFGFERRLDALYLESELSPTNILNALPIDLAKNVIQYV
jgi:hypothetical protein